MQSKIQHDRYNWESIVDSYGTPRALHRFTTTSYDVFHHVPAAPSVVDHFYRGGIGRLRDKGVRRGKGQRGPLAIVRE